MKKIIILNILLFLAFASLAQSNSILNNIDKLHNPIYSTLVQKQLYKKSNMALQASDSATMITNVCTDAGFESGTLSWTNWHGYYGMDATYQDHGFLGDFDCSNTSTNNMDAQPWKMGLVQTGNSLCEYHNWASGGVFCGTSCTNALGTIISGAYCNTPHTNQQIHHQIQSTGNDPIVGSLVPKVHSGNYSLRLGNDAVIAGQEKIEKRFVVDASTQKFSFYYSVVMGNPCTNETGCTSTHSANGITTFIVQVKDVTNPSSPILYNNLVDLGNGKNYVTNYDPLLLKTLSYTNPCKPDSLPKTGDEIAYKPWSYLQINFPNSLIDKMVSIEIITRDCSAGGHFSYAYLDDFCSSPSIGDPTGYVGLADSSSRCGTNGRICVKYSLPSKTDNGQVITGTVKLTLNTILNGGIMNAPLVSPILTNGSTYCFDISSLGSFPASSFDYYISADFSIGTSSLPQQIIGSTLEGVNSGNNNDYNVSCPQTNCPTCTFKGQISYGTPLVIKDLHCGDTLDLPCNVKTQGGITCAVGTSSTLVPCTVTDANGTVLSGFSPNGINPTFSTSGYYTFTYYKIDPTTGRKCDSCKVIYHVTCPQPPICDTSCHFALSVTNLTTNQTTVCDQKTIMQLSCGQSYNFNRLVSCTSGNTSFMVKQVNVVDANNQNPSWAVNFIAASAGGVLAIPANAASGTYTVTYTWGTANQVCGAAVYQFNISCPQTTDCCKNSYWKNLPKIMDRNTKEELATLDCKKPLPYIISYANKNCERELLIGGGLYICGDPKVCASKVVYTLTNNATHTAITGTDNLVIPANLANGNYTLKYEAYCGDKICDSCKFDVKKDCNLVPTCDCKAAGCTLQKKVYVDDAPFDAGSDIKLECNKKFIFSAKPFCGVIGCATPVVKAEIFNSQGFSVAPKSVVPLSFTFTATDTYTIVFTLEINGVICDSTKTKLLINCPPSVDCCKGSHWEDGPAIYNAAGAVLQKIDCAKPLTYVITNANKNCDQNLLVKGLFVCGDPKLCASKIVYTLAYNNGSPISTGINSITIPASLANGGYILKIDAYCGDKICANCSFEIRKDCLPVSPCDCKTIQCSFKPFYNVMPSGGKKDYICNSQLTLECNKQYAFGMEMGCQGNCTGAINDTIRNASGAVVATKENVSITNVLDYVFIASGNYTLTSSLVVNGMVCKTCSVTITVNCPPAACAPCNAAITSNTTVNVQTNAVGGVTQATQSFTFTGLSNSITEVRAIVKNITVYATDANGNKNEECLNCINGAAAWASIVYGTGIIGATPTINLKGTTTPVPLTAGQQSQLVANNQNPREIVWRNAGNIFAVASPILVDFLLPQPSSLSCCTRKAMICVKFIFRDNNCNECEVPVCFEVVIK